MLMEKYTLEVKPLRGNRAAKFIIWNQQLDDIHSEETVEFNSPAEIKQVHKEFKNKVAKLNK